MDIALILALWLLLVSACVLALVYVWRWSPQARFRQRARGLAGAVRERPGEGDEAGARRKLIQGKLKELEGQRARRRRGTLRQLLLQSGLPLSVRGYVLVSLGVGLGVAVSLVLLRLSPPVVALGAMGAALGLPKAALGLKARKRQQAFTAHFAEALDVLVRGTRSGLPVGECLRIIGRELPDPVGYEFRMLVEAQRVGMTMEQALERALERMPTTDLKFFAIVLVIQQQTGGNLAATLEGLANVLRARRRLKDKIQAMSSEAKASAAIIGSLPFLVAGVLWLVNPGYIGLLFSTTSGTYMLAGGGLWMTLGVLVMRQMINFRI
ncbi:type II secretion system F family protein [Azospirillum sp.]|uniref:type II secretion system F family protein n=1 Tax=Azospirillum sp. TaxID=34012 RepID=UPI002D56D367|nr:type II secretion system F family protein [Azospirillum sp.]HYD64561.1 type II secretion system F family protein [Azospirillum sp.]